MQALIFLEDPQKIETVTKFLIAQRVNPVVVHTPTKAVALLENANHYKLLVFSDDQTTERSDLHWFIENARHLFIAGDVLFIYNNANAAVEVGHKFRRPRVRTIEGKLLSEESLKKSFGL